MRSRCRPRRFFAQCHATRSQAEGDRKQLTCKTKLRQMASWRPIPWSISAELPEVADRHYRLGAVEISVYVELQKQYLKAFESLLDTKKEALEARKILNFTHRAESTVVEHRNEGRKRNENRY